MFRILWYSDAESDVHIIFQADSMSNIITILKTLIQLHTHMRSLDYIHLQYQYECQFFNKMTGEWERWQDVESGIDDIMEWIEYNDEVLTD